MSDLLDKIWMFYTNEGLNGDDHWTLYAITNEKKYAKQFKEERDMNKFKIKKMEDDHESWKELAREAGDAVLGIHYLQTRTKTVNSTYSTEEVPVLCTMYESQAADADFAELDAMTEGFWVSAPKTPIFKKNILKALCVLEYHKMEQMFAPYSPDFFDDPENDPDYAPPSVEIDEVGILINTFFHLFKK